MSQSKHKAGLEFTADLDFADILTNPILDIAARVWEADRYQAFQVCYRSMRTIDDLVDDRKESGEPMTGPEIAQYEAMLTEWLSLLDQSDTSDDFRAALLGVIQRFHLPSWPWQRLGKAMIYDLSHNGFASFYVFRHYAEGAAVAPASIFMHLCGVTQKGESYQPPAYDIAAMARDLALFSYCTHIIRDFQKDHRRHLNYFADNLLLDNNLTIDRLYAIASGGDIPAEFRNLVAAYVRFGQYYRARARKRLDGLTETLAPRYALSLEIIYELYSQIYDRIDVNSGRFTTEELNPAPEQVKACLEQTIARYST